MFDILLLSPHNIIAFPSFPGGWCNKHCSSSSPIPLFIIVILIDFSFSVDFDNRKLYNLKCNYNDKNTPPEIRNNDEYNYNSYYFRLGNLIFFLVFKKYPWNLEQIKNETKLIEIDKIRNSYSAELFNFIEGLIKENMNERLGNKDINELIDRPWFKGFNWKKLEKKRIKSPFNITKTKKNTPFCKSFNKRLKMVHIYLNIKNSIYFLILFQELLYSHIFEQFFVEIYKFK